MSASSVRSTAAMDDGALHETVIAAGSFGEVRHYPSSPVVSKMVFYNDQDSAANLKKEFERYIALHSALGDASEQGSFRCPRPRELWLPATREMLQADGSLYHQLLVAPYEPPVHSVYQYLAAAPRPSLIMDLIPPLPTSLVNIYRSECITDQARPLCPPIRLLRLYLGREDLVNPISQFAQGLRSDLPLGLERLEMLSKTPDGDEKIIVPPVKDIARGMGRVLARMHWMTGMDGGDVEYVLAGAGKGKGGNHDVQCYILDFNQCKIWLDVSKLRECYTTPAIPTDPASLTLNTWQGNTPSQALARLARKYLGQEAYYPRPHQPIYNHFKSGYLDEVEIIHSSFVAESGHDGSIDTFDSIGSLLRDSSRHFFSAYEEGNKEKQGRRSALRNKVTLVGRPLLYSTTPL